MYFIILIFFAGIANIDGHYVRDIADWLAYEEFEAGRGSSYAQSDSGQVIEQAKSAETPAVMNEIRNKCLGKVKINLEVLEKKFLTYNSDDARKYWKLLACLDKELNRFHNSNQMFNENELGTGAFETSENIVYRNYKIRSECKYQTGFDYQNFSIEGYGTYIKCVGAKLNLLGPDGKLDMRFFVKLIAHDKQLIDKVCNLSRLKEGTKRRSLALIQCVVGKINEMRIMERHEYKHRH